MRKREFSLEGLIVFDPSESLPLEPYLVSIADLVNCEFGEEMGFLDIRELKNQIIGLVKRATGEYVTHKENDVTIVHGAGVGYELYKRMFDNSLSKIESCEGYEWYNIISNDEDCAFESKNDFQVQLNIYDNEENILFGYTDGNTRDNYERYPIEGCVPIPCLTYNHINLYLVKKYGMFVSVSIGLDDEGYDDIIFRVIIQQIRSERYEMLIEEKGTLSGNVYYLLLKIHSTSCIGAYSIAFRVIRELIFDKSLEVK